MNTYDDSNGKADLTNPNESWVLHMYIHTTFICSTYIYLFMRDGHSLKSRQERRRKHQIDQNLFHLIRPLFVFIRRLLLVMDYGESEAGISFG